MSVLKQDGRASDIPRSSGRIHSLDVARGVAIFGTLASNIWLFTHVGGMAGSLDNPISPDTPEPAALLQHVLMALSAGKFLGLLTLMFGIGLEVQRRSMVRAGRSWPGTYLWRAALLFLDGVVNFVLVAEFDVLMGYAVTGALVAYLLLTSERAQWVWIWVTGVVHVLIITAMSGQLVATEGIGNPEMGSAIDPETSYPYATGSFTDLALFRLDNMTTFRTEPIMIFGLSVTMFLLGARLYRAGIFAAEGATLRKRLMIVGLGFLAPVDLAVGAFGGTGGFLFDRYVLAPGVALGLLALIAHIGLHTSRTGWFSARMQEVGRTALSGYVGQNAIASFVFYGWGLGLAAHLGAWRVPATVVSFVLIAAVVAASAHLWLRWFDQGPLEWLWKKGYLALSGHGRQ